MNGIGMSIAALCLLAATSGIVPWERQVPTLKQDEDAALREVGARGISGRFVIPEIKPSNTGPVASYTIVDEPTKVPKSFPKCKSATLRAEYPGDQVPLGMSGGGVSPSVDGFLQYPNDYAIAVCGELNVGDRAKGMSAGTEAEGTVWRFRGKHLYKRVVFEGDIGTPLVFLFHAQGFVYLTGKGTVVLRDGTSVDLPGATR